MRSPLLLLLCALAFTAHAGTGPVMKVFPLFVDAKGRSALSPSLYDRDAYQVILRDKPEQRKGVVFKVQWKSKGPYWNSLVLRVEIRGIAQGAPPKQLVLQQEVEPTKWWGDWTNFLISNEQYKELGEITAWRVTLSEGDDVLGEQKSF